MSKLEFTTDTTERPSAVSLSRHFKNSAYAALDEVRAAVDAVLQDNSIRAQQLHVGYLAVLAAGDFRKLQRRSPALQRTPIHTTASLVAKSLPPSWAEPTTATIVQLWAGPVKHNVGIFARLDSAEATNEQARVNGMLTRACDRTDVSRTGLDILLRNVIVRQIPLDERPERLQHLETALAGIELPPQQFELAPIAGVIRLNQQFETKRPQ